MSLNISVFNGLALRNGAMEAAPMLPDASSSVVATGAISAALPAGALIRVLADEDGRITWQASGTYTAPAVDALRLKAGAEQYFTLPKAGGKINYLAG